MKNTKISEKTLELNLCEELMTLVRTKYPNAFWYGPTLQDERELGYDTSLENVEGHVLFLQFKRPLKYLATNPKAYPYRFKIRTEQNNTLIRLAARFPRKVHYVFPLVGDANELITAIPEIRKETNFTPVEVVGDLDAPEKHRVDVWPDRIKVYSPIEGPSMNPDDVVAFPLGTSMVPFSAFALAYNQIIVSSYMFSVPTLSGTAYLMDSSPLHAMFIPITGRTRR